MSAKTSEERSAFAQRFESAYRHATLPRIYRQFILDDSYVPYRKSFIRGLWNYGPTDVELNLSSSILLRRDQLFAFSGVDQKDATEFHPIATLQESPQFLAIDATKEAAPVSLWHHETGAFHLQFDTFAIFRAKLRTPKEAREERAETRRAFADIRKECKPALSRAKKHFNTGELEAAAEELDTVLQDRRPIEYDGTNDFVAISILCDCFNLRGRVFLAHNELESARAAFLDAIVCGGTPYSEAVIDAIVTSLLMGDIQPMLERVGDIRAENLREPGLILKRNFTVEQIGRLRKLGTSPGLSNDQRGFVMEVLSWVAGT